ncbi:MAG: hypothetical protein HY711_06185 [Candidatus Melainabacteria bacterium]|nr:hypothetical protein [Candidatus Melainabacteria bacterium]
MVIILNLVSLTAYARQPWPNSPLAVESQIQLEKAHRYMRSGRFDKAQPLVLAVLDSANDVPKCLAIASLTGEFATPMMEVRRQCMGKALSLCSTRQDFIEVALKSRQYQFFEITRQAINALIQNATNLSDLYDLARKAQEVALNDVAHLAMERAYTGIKTVPEALKFAKEVKALGMDDLVRKVLKDLIDDEDNAHYLCVLLTKIEPIGMSDLNRYLLKKALDKGSTIDEFAEISEGARRNRETEIFKVAEYRAKKLKVIEQIKHDRGEYQRQLQGWQEGIQQDLARQQAEAERALEGGGKRFEGGSQETGSPTPGAPVSGF